MPRRFLYPRAASAILFPTVPHLAGSAADEGDVVFSDAATRAFLARPVRVVEKLDGLNVGLSFTRRGALRFVSRALGVLRPAQLGPGLWPLVDWAFEHLAALAPLLGPDRVLYGEWLGGPRRLPYPRRPSDFIAFALYQRGAGFLPAGEVDRRVRRAGLAPRPVRFEGPLGAVGELSRLCRASLYGGPAEGVVVEAADGRWAKWVRADWQRRPVSRPASLRVPRPRPVPTSGAFLKRFPAGRVDDAALEAGLLRELRPLHLAPGLRGVRPAPDGGVTLVLDTLPGAPWPGRVSPALAAALGRQLARLHGAPGRREFPRLVPAAGRSSASAVHPGRLAGGPAAHALGAARELAAPRARAVRERLVPFLRANAAGLAAREERLCHADLKPENLLVRGEAVWLLDFERACFADPAWELACAMDRLGLDAAGRNALLLGWSAERVDPELAVRAQLFRLAWQVALPPAVAAFTRETGRRPSDRARRLAGAAQRRGTALLAALARPRAGLRRPTPRLR